MVEAPGCTQNIFNDSVNFLFKVLIFCNYVVTIVVDLEMVLTHPCFDLLSKPTVL
jgi:hypothetical protein